MSDIRLYESMWREMPAWTLESARLRVVTTPELGAKITSIYDKAAAFEWLVSPPERDFKPVDYGAVFTDQDMSGWDDMFPTIKACTYPAPGPYARAGLPDHGEVWALPWQLEAPAGDTLTLGVDGRALPYHLSRTLALPEADTLRLTYTATNAGPHPITALWAAHPQFTATADTRICLPAEVTELYNVRDIPAWGAWGLRYAWPEAINAQGQPVRLDRVASATAGTCRKLYVPPEIPIPWAALLQEQAGHWLHMAWQPDELPYLGIWVDEGAVNSLATAALEVTNGFHDSLATAWTNDRSPVIAPGARMTWTVWLRVGTGPLP